MNKKILSIVLFLLLFVFTGQSWFGCGGEDTTVTDETQTETTIVVIEEPIATADGTTYDATITKNFEDADKDAKTWNPNAKLVMASVELPSDLALNSSTVTYTYGASDVLNYWWTYSLSEANGKYVRALVYKDDYIGSTLEAIPLQYWRTNYIEAFQIADNYQGKDFRSNHENVKITETLSIGEPNGFLWWLVEYSADNGDTLAVRLNPNDRTIVDENGEVIQKGSVYSPEATVTETDTTTTTTTESNADSGTQTSPSPSSDEYYFIE